MNIKKVIILPVGFILIHVLYIGCCKCVEGAFHKQLSGIKAVEYGNQDFYSKDSVFVADTLSVIINVQYNLVAKSAPNPFAPLVSTASAFSCNCGSYNDLGFTHPLDSIKITSNNIYKNIIAGEDISSQFSAQFISYDSLANSHTSIISLSQLVDSLNTVQRSNGIFLFTKPGVPAEKNHRFTYNLFSNGQRFTYSSGRVMSWQ